jgi:hypothetical protein
MDGLMAHARPRGERDTGSRGLTRTPWVSSYAPSYRWYGVF